MLGKYKVILFDLDGTISDPKIGITKSVQYALKKMNIDEPDIDQLEHFIGPPLRLSFEQSYRFYSRTGNASNWLLQRAF